MPPRNSTTNKNQAAATATAASEALAAANLKAGDIDPDAINWDALTENPPPGSDTSAPNPWEETAQPSQSAGGGDDFFSEMEDPAVPAADGAAVLAEYLPPIRQQLEVLTGQVSDYHKASTQRADSQLATYKALTTDLGNKIDTLESSVHECLVLLRTLVQGGGAPKAEPSATDTTKGKATTAKPPTLESIAAKHKAPGLVEIWKIMADRMPADKSGPAAKAAQFMSTKAPMAAIEEAFKTFGIDMAGVVTRENFLKAL